MALHRRIRLLYIHPTYTFGGAERVTLNLLSSLNRDHFSISLVTSKSIAERMAGLDFERVIDIEDLGIDVWFGAVNSATIRKFLKDIGSIRHLLKQERPDIAIGMMYYAASLLAIARKTLRCRAKVIVSPRGPLTAYLNTFMVPGTVDYRFWKLVFRISCQWAHSVLVAANGTAEDCIKKYGARKEAVKVIPNGIDLEEVQRLSLDRVHLFIQEGAFVLATAGRLVHEKNIPLLLRALVMLKGNRPVYLIVIGEGPERRALETLATNLGLAGNVFFAGFQENPYAYMRRAHVFVHTCLLEGFGNVMVEAMACGVPVIATDCPYGPRDIITHGTSGLLVPMQDHEALAEVIRSLINDEEWRMNLAAGALERSRAFSIDAMVRAYETYLIWVAE
jgi:glycosyltransferase involved in cell wall biosynthesis